MEWNAVASNIELAGTTVKALKIRNNIIDLDKNAKRNFSLNINEPEIQFLEDKLFLQMTIDFVIDIEQAETEQCRIEMSMEGAFFADYYLGKNAFLRFAAVNGAAALIGMARGKIESITANIFNNGKIVIPIVNVIDYYNNLLGSKE